MPPAVREPLSTVAPMKAAELPLRSSPPEVRLSTSLLAANASVPAPVETKFSELSNVPPLTSVWVPVKAVTFALDVEDPINAAKEAGNWS